MIDTDKYALVIDDDGYFCEDKIADLLAEVKRLRKIEQEHGRVIINDWEHKPHGDADAHPLPYVTVYHGGCEYVGCLRLYKNEDGYSDEYSYLQGD